MRKYNISSDLVQVKSFQPIVYKQYDNGDNLEVELFEDGTKINLTDEIVLAFFELEDGTVIQKTCTVNENGNAVATLDNNVLSIGGKLKTEFTVYKDGKETTTRTIIITVEQSINRNESIETIPQWDIVHQVLDLKASDGSAIEEKINVLNEAVEVKFNELAAAAQVDSEVVLARGGEVTLGQRLDKVSSSLADIVTNVKLYGAKLDGVTDDTVALQSAIDFCKTHGKRLYIPSGTLLYNQKIILFDGLKIFGEGLTHTILKYTGSESFAIGYDVITGQTFEEVENVSIKDLTITTTNPTVDLLFLEFVNYSEFKEVKFTGGNNAVNFPAGWTNVFDNCHFLYNNGYAFLMNSANDGCLNSNYIQNCTIERNTLGGIKMSPNGVLYGGQGNQIILNTIQHNGSSTDSSQIILEGYTNTVIRGNYFEPTTDGVGSLIRLGKSTGTIDTKDVHIEDNYFGMGNNSKSSAEFAMIDLKRKVINLKVEHNTFWHYNAPLIKSSYDNIYGMQFVNNFTDNGNADYNDAYFVIDGNIVNRISDYTPPDYTLSTNNFIVDGDFENGTFGWTVEGSAVAFPDTASYHSGTKSLNIQTDATTNKIVFPVRGLRANAQNVLSMFVKNNTASAQTFKADIYDVDSVLLGSITYTVGSFSPYTLITIPFTSANKLDRTITVKLYGGNFFIDRLNVTEGKSTIPNAKNPLDSFTAFSTANRPTNPILGQEVFDKTLNRPIWWNGTSWIDKVVKFVNVPSTPTSAGSIGDCACDGTNMYICYATNSWRRFAVSTW